MAAAANAKTAIGKIKRILNNISIQISGNLLNQTKGKAYELYILAKICEDLHSKEGLIITLQNSNGQYRFQAAPGNINRSTPYFKVEDQRGTHIGDLFTNVEFLTLSYFNRISRGGTRRIKVVDKHELDVLLIKPIDSSKRNPAHDEVLLGASCKDTAKFNKDYVREVLGVRRELSYYNFSPTSPVVSCYTFNGNSDPPSMLNLYSTCKAIQNYSAPGAIWDINFLHQVIQ